MRELQAPESGCAATVDVHTPGSTRPGRCGGQPEAPAEDTRARPSAQGQAIDWRAVFMLPPRRRFNADELRRAIPARHSRTFRVGVAVNVLAAVPALWLVMQADDSLLAFALGLALLLALVPMLHAIWRNPSGRAARWGVGPLALVVGLALVLSASQGWMPRHAAQSMSVLAMVSLVSIWAVVVYRHQYVVLRLNELAERERAVDMARRLTSAQLAPHFLFNSLASLQHWVATKDDRAGPLLADLTAYLRSTLPMFDRPSWPLADELQATGRYLSVMQARLGEARLRWQFQVPQALHPQPIPPGLLLTLVENAVGHGIEPLLAGGQVRVQAWAAPDASLPAGHWCLRVIDNGAGPAAGGVAEGVGLRNGRERLALLFGASATLRLRAGEGGGAVAEAVLPLSPPLALSPSPVTAASAPAPAPIAPPTAS